MPQNLILLHGALGSKEQFNPLLEALPPNIHAKAVNFEGHGGTQTHQDFSMDLFVQNTLDYLRNENLEKVNIFGYSMGGYVALNLAKSHPHRVGRIMSLGTKFDWSWESAKREIKMLNPDKIEEKVPAFAKKLKETHDPADWKEVVFKTALMMSDLAGGQKLTDEDLANIDHETLIGIGSMDRMVTVNESENAANVLPNGRLEIIEGFQHPLEKIDVEKLAELISDFLG